MPSKSKRKPSRQFRKKSPEVQDDKYNQVCQQKSMRDQDAAFRGAMLNALENGAEPSIEQSLRQQRERLPDRRKRNAA